MSTDFSLFTTVILSIVTFCIIGYGLFHIGFFNTSLFTNVRAILQKNGLFIVLTLYLIGLSYVIGGNKSEAMNDRYFNATLIAGPIILAFIFLLRNSDANMDFTQALKLNASTVLPLIIIGLLFGGLLYSDSVDTKAVKFFGNILLASIFILGAVLFFQVFKNIAYSLEGLSGIVARVLIFIPCLISDFITYFFGQLGSSPFVVYVLLAVEVALVLAYLYLPKMMSAIDETSGKRVLLTSHVLLKNETRVIGASELYEKLELKPLTKPRTGNMALSMWIYVVPMSANQSPYNEEAAVFEFGNQHPRITYKQSVLKVYYAPGLAYEIRIPTQTWVHVVYNYNDNNADLFINGDLVKTANYPMLMTNPEDMIVVGQERGIHGGLTALVFSKQALTDLEIKRLYETGNNKDPPMA